MVWSYKGSLLLVEAIMRVNRHVSGHWSMLLFEGVVTITCCGEGLDHSEPDMLRLHHERGPDHQIGIEA